MKLWWGAISRGLLIQQCLTLDYKENSRFFDWSFQPVHRYKFSVITLVFCMVQWNILLSHMVRLRDAMAWHATPVPDSTCKIRTLMVIWTSTPKVKWIMKGDTLFPHYLIGQKGLRSHVIGVACNTYWVIEIKSLNYLIKNC